MPLQIVETSEQLPFDIADVKAALRIESDEDDEILARLIADAIQQCETITWRTIRERTLCLILDDFECREIHLPRPKCNAVTSVEYYDITNTLRTLSPSWYQVDIVSQPGEVELAYGYYWPNTYPRNDAVKITYTAGYRDGDEIPECIFSAVCIYVAAIIYNKPPDYDAMRDVLSGIAMPEFM